MFEQVVVARRRTSVYVLKLVPFSFHRGGNGREKAPAALPHRKWTWISNTEANPEARLSRTRGARPVLRISPLLPFFTCYAPRGVPWTPAAGQLASSWCFKETHDASGPETLRKKPARQLASVFDYFLVSWFMDATGISFNAIHVQTLVGTTMR